MVFRELGSDQQILDQGENPVGKVFPEWHPASEGVAAENTAAQDARMQAGSDQGNHRGNELWSVLIVGVNHDDDISPGLQREAVTRLLVGAVTPVQLMNVHL